MLQDLGGPATPVKRQYEFAPDEETTFSELMDSIRDTGGATMLLCLSHFMHVVAKNFAPGTSLLECVPGFCVIYAHSGFSHVRQVILAQRQNLCRQRYHGGHLQLLCMGMHLLCNRKSESSYTGSSFFADPWSGHVHMF